jgi:20S proteasome alpha/beta subunit
MKLTEKEYQAIGWTHAYCCSLLDNGWDPRKIEVPEMIEKAESQLSDAGKDGEQ